MVASTAGLAAFNAITGAGHSQFFNSSNAGQATMNAGKAASNSSTDPDGFTGGSGFFRDTSNAAKAQQ